MMKRKFLLGLLLGSSFLFISPSRLIGADKDRIIANPLNLNYRFQFEAPSYREAADPVIELFNGKYYLFASKSGGYWSSDDLVKWSFIPCSSISTIEGYAPTIVEYKGALYYISSGAPRIFKSTNPETDNWQAVDTKFSYGMTDPAFFKDDNGDMFMYWGCSDKDPIMGVQIDPEDGFRAIGEPVVLIEHNTDKYGWEVPGDKNDENRIGWNEGPCVIKHNGKYLLQYAAPGTQYRTYGDGLYVSDNPLGSYTYMEESPFSFKPGGFIGGAGHGHTFCDKYGNYWHVATMKISIRHSFERRIGLFPAYVDNDGLYAHTVLTDYPFRIPDKKVNMVNNDLSVKWNLLSYGKAISASSSLTDYDAPKANDEQVETWWSAASGTSGEWLAIDLGKTMRVEAVQINFADQNFSVTRNDTPPIYRYNIESSNNGIDWKTVVDRSSNKKDMVHELIVLDSPLKTRYIRVKNKGDMQGMFSIYDFRVFGQGGGSRPAKVTNLAVKRNSEDKRRIDVTWDKSDNATGYILNWGTDKHRLNNSVMIYSDTQFEGGFFNRDSDYYFSIDTFNENGISTNASVYKAQ